MAETAKEIYDRFNAPGGPLEQIQQQYRVFNGNGQSDFNAVAHAYTSAAISYHHGSGWADLYGEGREVQTRLGVLFGEFRLQTEGESRDGLRDVFNNRVGNQIAEYARENGLPERAMAELVGDALARGLLMVNEFRDSRILDYRLGTRFGLADPLYDGPSADVARAIELKYGLPRGSLSVGTLTAEAIRAYFDAPLTSPRPMPRPDECFLAGTRVTMADGSTKPIEQVRAGDWVMSFDPKTGETKPGRVKRTMQNRAKIVLDFHGTFVTPGHVYWCAGGTFAGRFAPLIDILRDDGVIQHADGTLIRAATGCAVGSPDDEAFWAFLTREEPDGTDRIIDKCQLRFGTRWMLPDGRHFTMRDYMAGIGVEPQPDGYMRWTRQGITAPFVWVLSDRLPNPEDFVLARSRTTLADIYRAGEWEGMQPAMPPPMVRDGGPVLPLSATRLVGVKRNVPIASAGGAASSVLLPERAKNGRQRKAEEARQRQEEKRRFRQVH